jgi:hypothetical protein
MKRGHSPHRFDRLTRAWAFLAPGTSDGWMLHGWFV